MSNGDDGGKTLRKAHVYRVYKDEDRDSDTWVDVERIDEIIYEKGQKFPGQLTRWQFDWQGFDPHGGPFKTLKNPDDKDSTLDVPIRNEIKVLEGQRRDVNGSYVTKYQEYRHIFNNSSDNTKRHTTPRRIYHYDISDDKLDDNKQPPSDPDDYVSVLKDRDKTQHVDVEVLVSYTTNEGSGRQWWEKRWLQADTDPFLDKNFQPGQGGDAASDVGDSGIDPPYRLDPLQNIINVKWGGKLAVKFSAGAG